MNGQISVRRWMRLGRRKKKVWISSYDWFEKFDDDVDNLNIDYDVWDQE